MNLSAFVPRDGGDLGDPNLMPLCLPDHKSRCSR